MDYNHNDNGHTQEQVLEAVNEGEQLSHLLFPSVGIMAELRSVGKVEISDEATLEDLKTQVDTF